MCTGNPLFHAPLCLQYGACQTWLFFNYQQQMAMAQWWQSHQFEVLRRSMNQQAWYNDLDYDRKRQCTSFLNSIRTKPDSRSSTGKLANYWKALPDDFKEYLEAETSSGVRQFLSFLGNSIGNF
jgi:hypothetical protein